LKFDRRKEREPRLASKNWTRDPSSAIRADLLMVLLEPVELLDHNRTTKTRPDLSLAKKSRGKIATKRESAAAALLESLAVATMKR
jgi:hypothetical protein